MNKSRINAGTTAVMKYCQDAQVSYCQSDEISVLLRNDMTHQTDPFLANRTQKIASLCASKVSVAFNKEMALHGVETEAVFDCRVFVLPPSEVNNYFLWRQRDAFRNCITSVAYWGLRKLYGRKTAHKKMQGLSTSERQELIFQELGTNPNDIETEFKRGRCMYRDTYQTYLRDVLPSEKAAQMLEDGVIEDLDKIVTRSRWVVDREIPQFDSDPEYISKYLG